MDENTTPAVETPAATPVAEAKPAKVSKPKAAKPAAKAKPKAAKKVVAKKAAKAKPKAATGDRLVPADLDHYVVNKDKKTPGGNPSIDIDDKTAQILRGKPLDDVYKAVAKSIGEDEKALRAKYKHLNLGMQRMNLGNRLRAVIRAKEAPKG